MRGNFERRLQLAISQNLEPVADPFDHAAVEEEFRGDGRLGSKIRQVTNVHQSVALLEDVGEATLGETPVERHLAAFKSRAPSRTGAGFLALGAARRSFSVSRPGAKADPLPAL